MISQSRRNQIMKDLERAPFCGNDARALILQLEDMVKQQQTRIEELETEHEAKVITLDGLSNYRGPVWMLEKTSSGMVWHWRKPFSGFDTGIYACFEEECYLVEEYGKTWLPWTKKPTNERIKAVKWDETD